MPETKHLDRVWRMSEVLEEYYNDDIFEPSTRFNYYYNLQYPNQVDSISFSMWDVENAIWIPYVNLAFTYDATHEYVTNIIYSYTFYGFPFPVMRLAFSYDNLNRFTYMVRDYYDMDFQEWINESWLKIIYVSNSNYTVYNYSADGVETERGTWSRTNFTWDAQGRITTETSQVSSDSLSWTNDYFNAITYHPNDTTTGDIFVNNLAHQMPFMFSMEYGNSNIIYGMVSQIIENYWDGAEWFQSYRELYNYNAANQLIEYYEEYWDYNDWVEDYKEIWTYNANNNLYQIVTYWWNWLDEWYPENRYTYSWENPSSNDNSTIPVVKDLFLSVSPNPFSNEISIHLSSKNTIPAKVAVYNVKGQQVQEIATKSNGTVLWDGRDKQNIAVSIGIYFIKAETANGSITRKVVKVK